MMHGVKRLWPSVKNSVFFPTRMTSAGALHTVVLLRHGQSLWNVQNRFTGWCDVPLTEHGEADAVDAGQLMGSRGLKFDVAFTSNLERAWRTCALALAASGQSSVETIRSSKLNERHYGGGFASFLLFVCLLACLFVFNICVVDDSDSDSEFDIHLQHCKD